jgi:hypothetical protein
VEQRSVIRRMADFDERARPSRLLFARARTPKICPLRPLGQRSVHFEADEGD